MKRELRAGFVIYFMTCIAHCLFADNPFVQQYTVSDGLPSNTVYQVFQDSNNFIWFATDAGAARFDGTYFSYFTNKNGLNTNEIYRIEEDSRGRIWFFNMNGSFNFLLSNTIYNNANAPFLKELGSGFLFRRFYEDENKTLYFFDNLNMEVQTLNPDNEVARFRFPDITARFVFKDRPSFLFMPLGILHEDDGLLTWYMSSGIYTSGGLNDSLHLKDGSIFIERVFGQRDSIMFLEVRNLVDAQPYLVKSVNGNFTDTLLFPQRLGNELATYVFQDEEGRQWISSYHTGIYCLSNNHLVHHFGISKAQNILQDHQGNIWFCTLGSGAYKLNPFFLKSRHYETSFFDNEGLESISKHSGGGIWATNGRRVFLVKNGSVYPSVFHHDSDGIDKIAELQNNTLLLNETNYFLRALQGIVVKNNMVTHTSISYHGEMTKMFSLIAGADKVATFYPFSLFQTTRDKLFDAMERTEVLSERIFNVYFNHHDELFVNGKDIYIYENGSLTPYKPLEMFSGKIVRQHLNLDCGAELFNIGGDSLYLYFNNQVCNLTAAFDQPVEQAIIHTDYQSPYLYLATASKLYYCEYPIKAVNGQTVQLHTIDLFFKNIQQILTVGNTLYVAGDDGLTCIPLQTLRETQTNLPKPYFRNVLINDNHALADQGQISLRGPNRMQFVFGNIDFTGGAHTYAYMLDGVDNDWIIGLPGNVVFSNIRPGNYTLLMKVKKTNTGWSEPVAFVIRVRPAFYQHPLFYATLFLLFSGLMYRVFLHNRNKKIRQIKNQHQLLLLEQKALQSMMNPHFIFNALGSIQNYILKNKPHDAGLYLSKFARLIRQNMNAIQSTTIALDEEVDRLRNYLDLERMRMDNRFNFAIHIADDIEEDVLIPSMIIQPIVENAIWHGLSVIEEDGMVTIRFTKNITNCLTVIIEDNGIGIEKAKAMAVNKESHLEIGMQLTRKRLELFSRDVNLTTHPVYEEAFPGRENPGTRVTIALPCVGEGRGSKYTV